MRVHVLFHDRCFDGMASAATFTRFYKDRVDPAAEFTYRGLSHKPGSAFDPSPFTDADVHACVDFRYSASPKLTWWFDHHQSAFETPDDEKDFRAKEGNQKFHDAHAKSCTRFLARVAQERYGFDPSSLKELVEWAEIIDGALFPDAKTAVELEAPAMKLMLLAEATKDDTLIPRLIADLSVRPLSEVVASSYVAEPLKPILAQHWNTVEKVRERARFDQGVVTFDLSDLGIENFNKFISYYLYPDARYTVAVSAGAKRAKISVGSSPWPKVPRTHNIAEICESYGGGGHPAVGAISLKPEELGRAREIQAEIVKKLQS